MRLIILAAVGLSTLLLASSCGGGKSSANGPHYSKATVRACIAPQLANTTVTLAAAQDPIQGSEGGLEIDSGPISIYVQFGKDGTEANHMVSQVAAMAKALNAPASGLVFARGNVTYWTNDTRFNPHAKQLVEGCLH